jgi:hypothetical protein
MLEQDIYNIAIVALTSATAGISGMWFYASKLIEKERQKRQQIEQDISKIKETEKALQLNLSKSDMENKRLRALFEIPTVFDKTDRSGKWASLAQLFETQLSRLACESRDLASAVGSMKTALPVATEQLSGSLARLYVAAAVSVMNFADTLAKETGKSLQLKEDSISLQVTVEVAEELTLRVGRLDSKQDGLVLLCVGKQGRINETAWTRTLMTLHDEPELIGKPLNSQQDVKTKQLDLPILKGLSLPSSLITSLSRAGVSNLTYFADDDSTMEQLSWPKHITEALRRIPRTQNSNVSFKIKLFHMPEAEFILNRVSNGWLLAQTDLTKPDPWRLMEQVIGFLRFKGQAVSIAG